MGKERILLKLSGEALAAQDGIYDFDFVNRVAQTLVWCAKEGYQLAVVIGGGNIWRGRQGKEMDAVCADSMGMTATVINAFCLADAIARAGGDAAMMTSFQMHPLALLYRPDEARALLDQGKIVVLGGGLGLPHFSTDTAGAVRAAELRADLMLMAKNVDFIYDKDPKIYPDAKRFEQISMTEMISRDLRAIDATAATFCRDAKIPVRVFGLKQPEDILRAVRGETVGTVITPD